MKYVFTENTPGGVSLVTAFATDNDSGINADFSYWLKNLTGPGYEENPTGTYFFEVGAL